ncbi:MAG: tetratricopeptide repeat protein [Candidatus Omnitrophota bacterium]|nr:tetratricopeptide repeat protein [Candidatus Omnitrophota bacterium]
MMRASQKSPLSFYPLGALFLLVFLLTGAKSIIPGDILQQEGVFYRTEGLQLQKTGELYRAAAAFRQAIYVKPDYAEAYNDLGVVLESLGDLGGAEQAYNTALKFKPDLGSAHSNLALLYEGSDRLKQAAAHWGARVRLGPPKDPWVVVAREKLAKYQLPVLETDGEKAQKKDQEIRRMIAAGKGHLEAKRWDKAIEEFEQVLKINPAHAEALQLLRSARTRAAQTQGRQIRELEAAKGRVTKEAANARHEEAARKAELERERTPVKPFQSRSFKESEAANQKQTVRQLKQLEEARRKAAKRIEAEIRSEKIKARAAADRKFKELEKAKKIKPSVAPVTKPVKPPVVPVVKPVAEVKVKPAPSTAPLNAQALAREIVKEKSKVRKTASDDLLRRAALAMREGLYQDAIESYKQVLILEPGNRSAKQGLERAQKAFAKQL